MNSEAGQCPKPFECIYSSSKYAMEGFIESLSYEIAPFGIKVVLIEPGFIRTSLAHHTLRIPSNIMDYKNLQEIVWSNLNKDVKGGADPNKVASLVRKVINLMHPRLRYRVGKLAHLVPCFRWLLRQSLLLGSQKTSFSKKDNIFYMR